MKLHLALVLLVSSFIFSEAHASRWTEPVLVPPFAEEVPLPEICKNALYDSVVEQSAQDGISPGGPVFRARAYRIKMRGFLYEGSDLVFEAGRVYESDFKVHILFMYRGELIIEGDSCSAKNVHYYKTYRDYGGE